MASRNNPPTDGRARCWAPATMLIFAVSLVLSLISGTGVLLQAYVLRVGNVTLESLLVSPLLYWPGPHMIVTLLGLLCLGSLLETCWGTARFVAFYLFVSWSAAALTVLAGWLLGINGASCGSAAFVLGALIALGLHYPDHKIIWSLPSARYLAWCFAFLGAAGLAALDLHGRSLYVFLVPQVSGVGLGMAFVALDPLFQAWFEGARKRRAVRERERIRDMRSQVDQLLDKINADGFQSLTKDEQVFLRQASKHYRD